MRLAILVLCAVLASEAHAYELKTTASGAIIRWPSGQRDIRVIVDQTTEPERRESLITALEGATRAWSAGSQVTLTLDADGGAAELAPVMEISWPTDHWPYEASQLAVTEVRLEAKSGAILSAKTRVNDDYEWREFDLQSVLTHELGHALGLAHSEEPEATMHAGAAPHDTKRRTLEDDDRRALIALYGSSTINEGAIEGGAPPYGCTTASGRALAPYLLPPLAAIARLRARSRTSSSARSR